MAGVGIELELGVLLTTLLFGAEIFAPFEVETPAWKKILKWSIVIALTLGLYPWIGHWAATIPVALAGLGFAFHLHWCRHHEIHPLRATPRRRYYQLRGWDWPD